MAREQNQADGRPRLVTIAAVAALGVATALAFGRIFAGRLPTWKLIGAAVASALIAAALERRGLALALLGSAAGLALALTWLVFPQTAWYGAPSLRTLRALGRSLEYVGQQAREQVAPTGPLPPLMLAAVTAVWTATFSSHALSIRAGSPMLAILPPVALVAFADAVLEDGPRPAYAVAVLAAALAVVFVDGLRRIRQWGPVWTAFRSRRLSSAAVRGARQVALLVILGAVLLPGLLPGFRAQGLVDFSTSAGGVRLDPFVSIHAQLERRDPVELLRVTAREGSSYWRLYALDAFDGATWSSTDPTARDARVFATPARLPNDFPETAKTLTQHYRVLTDLGDPWLPMAYPAEFVTVPFGALQYDPELGTAVVPGRLEAGLEYTVTSRVVAPTPEELDLVEFEAPGRYGRFTFVPASVDPEVGEVAREWTQGAGTPYRQVLAIQDRFRGGSFAYSLDVSPTPDRSALLEFLTQTRTGFCQQFSTAMAILVRELGFPARVAVGYRPGTQRGDVFTVETKDAHSWVEVFFPGHGWLPFEPTPGRSNPIAEPGTYLNPTTPIGPEGAGQGQQGEGAPAGTDADCRDPSGRRQPAQACGLDPRLERAEREGATLIAGTPAPAPSPEPEDGYSIPYRWILLGLLSTAGTLMIVVPPLKSAWRRVRLRRSREPREHVLAVYRVFDGEAADLGMGRREGETLEEHRARLAAEVAFSDGHLGRLAAMAGRAAYALAPPTPDEARAVERDAKKAIRDLRKDAGWIRRIVGTYRPGL